MEESSEQKELLNAMNRWVTAFNDEDIEAIYKVEKEVIGFGWRSPNFRDRSKVSETDFKRGIKNIYASMNDFHGNY